jgi:SSS family transporter
MENNLIDILIIGIYFLALLGIGYYTSKKIKGTEDYSIAGRSLSFPILLGTLIGTTIGASSTMGKAGKAYEIGIAFFFASLAYPIGLFLFGFIAPIIRRTKIWTLPDVLVIRYGESMRIGVGIAMILGITALFGGQLIAIGLVAKSILGNITYTEAILSAGIIMVIYTLMGGLLAVAYTDFIQTIIMIISIGIILPFFIISHIGGFSVALEYLKPPPGNFWGGLSFAYVFSIFLIDLPFCLIDPSLWQRAAAAKDVKIVKRSMFITSGVYVFWSFIAVFLGIMASHIFPNLAGTIEGADAAMPMEIAIFLPPVVRGLCVAGMMAVMMSTAAPALLIAGITFGRDFVGSFYPNLKDKTLLLITRIFILAIGSMGIVFALHMKGIFDILLLSFAIFVSAGFVPTMAALFWKKATKAGAISSSIVSSIAVVILYGIKITGKLPTWIEPIIVSIGLSFILMIAVSLATYTDKNATPRLIDMKEQ